MKLLRQIIRNLILEEEETIDKWEEKFEKDFKWMWIHRRNKEYSDWFEDDDYTKHRDLFIQDRDAWDAAKQYEVMKKTRREIKQWWYDNAEHEWINDNVIAMHSLSYYGAQSSTLKRGISEEGDLADLTPAAFFEQYDPKSYHKDEMSAWGLVEGIDDIAGWMKLYGNDFAVRLQGRITYASYGDAFSESRSKALPSDIERHKSSGLPKRPAIDKDNTPFLVQEDFEDRSNPGEVIVDNWKPIALYWNKSSLGAGDGYWENILGDIEQQYGIKVIGV